MALVTGDEFCGHAWEHLSVHIDLGLVLDGAGVAAALVGPLRLFD